MTGSCSCERGTVVADHTLAGLLRRTGTRDAEAAFLVLAETIA